MCQILNLSKIIVCIQNHQFDEFFYCSIIYGSSGLYISFFGPPALLEGEVGILHFLSTFCLPRPAGELGTLTDKVIPIYIYILKGPDELNNEGEMVY